MERLISLIRKVIMIKYMYKASFTLLSNECAWTSQYLILRRSALSLKEQNQRRIVQIVKNIYTNVLFIFI